MPETFNPVTLTNNTGQPLNAAYFNRLETGVESLDDRAAALELGIYTPLQVPFATSITLTATQGALFRCIASGDLTLDAIVGGTDGQTIIFEVLAQGGTRILDFTDPAIDSVSILVNTWWSGLFRYYSDNGGSWKLLEKGDAGGGVGTVTTADIGDFTEGSQDVVGPLFTSGTHSGISFTYDDSNGRINAAVDTNSVATTLDPRYGVGIHVLGNSGGSTVSLDAASASGYVKTITLTGNCTFTLTGATSGQVATLELYLTQDGTGSRTVSWPSSVRWDGGTTPVLSATAGATDCVVLRTVNGGATWFGNIAGKGYA